MERVQADSAEAFAVLYDRFCDRAYRVAWSVCQHHGRAEDAVQDAFVSVWRSRSTYRPADGTVAAWVLSVVRYRAIDVARRHAMEVRRRADEELLDSVPAGVDVAGRAEAHAEAGSLRQLLGQLPDAQREVIVMAFFGELTHTEIATQLGLPAGTVKGRMRLGLQKLRRSLESVGGCAPRSTSRFRGG